MDINQLMDEINEALTRLENLLFNRQIELHLDEDAAIYVVGFNGFVTLDGFENEIIGDELPLIETLIEARFLLELDKPKIKILLDSIVARLESRKVIEDEEYKTRKQKLDQLQTAALKTFEELQEKVSQDVVTSLKNQYLIGEANGKPTKKGELLERITWKGPANELIGLFINLDRKGWISSPMNRSAFVRMLTSVFDLTTSEQSIKTLESYLQKGEGKYGAFKNIPSNTVKSII
jgi:hypothetical protein